MNKMINGFIYINIHSRKQFLSTIVLIYKSAYCIFSIPSVARLKYGAFNYLYLHLVPFPDMVSITVISNQTVGQSLTLESSITTVRGITSRVDIVWRSNGVELRRIEGVNVSFASDSSVTYTDYYNVFQLNTSDDGRVYQCESFVNTSPPLKADGNFILDVTG